VNRKPESTGGLAKRNQFPFWGISIILYMLPFSSLYLTIIFRKTCEGLRERFYIQEDVVGWTKIGSLTGKMGLNGLKSVHFKKKFLRNKANYGEV